MFEGKVRNRIFSSAFLGPVFAEGFVVFILWYSMAQLKWQSWLPILCILVFIGYKSGLFKLLFYHFNLHAFTITVNGIVSKEGYLIRWTQIKEVVFFNHCGYPHMGIKLKETETTIDGKLISETFEKDPDWPVYKMPIVTMTDCLSLTPKELANIFKNDYNVPVRYIGKEIEAGNEGEI